MPKTPARTSPKPPERTNSPREVRSFGSSKRSSLFLKELAAVPIEAVAAIAATLSREGLAPTAATRGAYELLELATLTKSYLEIGRSFHAALDFQEAIGQETKDLPANIVSRRENGHALPVPFDEAMATLLPNVRRKDEAMVRFRKWLQAADGLTLLEAGEQIAAMKREGIPPNLFQLARMGLKDWLARQKKAVRSQAGRKGAEARTANKGKKKKIY